MIRMEFIRMNKLNYNFYSTQQGQTRTINDKEALELENYTHKKSSTQTHKCRLQLWTRTRSHSQI